ncbi:MAG: hypothetical protein Q8916_06325 [Bacteroidota bacterium]|nr:hypothetical protein [Bacteroidota bacterium]MDP4230006.1 hypothetical protein [Bacteroidota bacterium]MDP4237689.1 hypothetical protein [Bacteroidota bacterium]
MFARAADFTFSKRTMNLFNRYSKEERKENDTLRIRLLQVFALIFVTVVGVSLGFSALFGQTPNKALSRDDFYVPCLIVLFNMVPAVMRKFSWKVIIPQTIVQTVLVTIFVLAIQRIW